MKYIVFILSLSYLLYGDIIIDSGNLNKSINSTTNKAYQHDKARERQKKAKYRETVGANDYCSYREECYTIIKQKGKRTEIKCRNGSTNNIYYDPENGKYYQQGFIMRNYEASFKKIANYSCGVF